MIDASQSELRNYSNILNHPSTFQAESSISWQMSEYAVVLNLLNNRGFAGGLVETN